MGLRLAVANGNWSSPSTWNGGVVPTVGDTVASNNFTVTIDQNINVDSLTNAVTNPVSSVPVMTGYTTPSGIVTASSQYLSASGEAWKAFDNATNTYWISENGSFGVAWLAYEFSTPRVITNYTISNPNTGPAMPRDWTIEAWNGSSWVVLHTVTGNTNTSTYSASFANSTAYNRYRINITSTVTVGFSYTSIGEFKMYVPNDSLVASVAGGGFVLNSGVTVTCTGGGVVIGNNTCLTYASTGSSTINSNISGISASIIGVVHSSTGTLNINGNIIGSTTVGNSTVVSVTSTGILNVTGDVTGNGPGSANGIRMASGSVLNLIGNIFVSVTQKNVVTLLAGSTLNMTGNATCQLSTANSGVCIDANAATVNVTGNLSITNATNTNNVNWYCIGATNICTINITGTVSNDATSNAMAFSYPVYIVGSSYYKHIGALIGGLRAPAVYNLVSTAINIFTGPFISSSSGILPIYVSRMNYFRTLGSYYEFRDSSTNGALPPAAPAPAIRMNSPEVASDLPTVANVRFGTVYGAGSFTGTMRVPAASNVRLGVAVDNTVGTGAITAQDVWNVLTSGMNTTGSIGARLKNASTVDTTGNQLAAYL